MQGTGIRWLRRAAGAFPVLLLAGVALMPVEGAYAAGASRHGWQPAGLAPGTTGAGAAWRGGVGLLPGAYAVEPSPHGSLAGSGPQPGPHAVEPSPHGSLAGSRAGVGRTPPGRPLLPVTDFDEPGLPPPPPPAEPSASTPPDPRPEQPAADRQAAASRDTEPLVNVVPLGAGLLLTGLGIGFLALRLRR